MSTKQPTILKFEIPSLNASATAKLLWDKAPLTCEAIVSQMPYTTMAFHGRNSGDEALCLTPSCITNVKQDETENAQTEHNKNGVYFGFEEAGKSYGGASSGSSCSEIAWIYGDAAQACNWQSVHGEPHDKPPFVRKAANINLFAIIIEENNFYTASSMLQRKGEQEIKLWVE